MKYVQFTTPGASYLGYRTYLLPSHIEPSNVNAMQITVNYRGPLPGAQKWTWSLYNWQSDEWLNVGTNTNELSDKWTLFTFAAPAPFERFINASRIIRLRLGSNSASGDAWLDFESIKVTYSAPLPSGAYWKPDLETSWQIQYSGTIDVSLDVDVYNLDAFETPKSMIDDLHTRGIKVMCYFSAGSWENWRPDKDEFPAYVLGKTLSGWPDEKWLDIRRLDILGPIMIARIELCKDKGFDGIDPDNIEGYANDTGLPLTYQDQLNYNIFLAYEAHQRRLAAGLKNDLGQIPVLARYFDWELNEQCFFYDECDLLLPFINAGKPVFNIEYDLYRYEFCAQANVMNFNSLRKKLNLDAWRRACR